MLITYKAFSTVYNMISIVNVVTPFRKARAYKSFLCIAADQDKAVEYAGSKDSFLHTSVTNSQFSGG